jgi:hypothetical protein
MTMVELLIAVAITGVIVAFTGTAVYQILNVSGYGNDRLSAQHDLQNAASWFQLDIQGAVTVTGGSQLNLTLSDSTTVNYALTSNELRRTAGASYIVLAHNIGSVSFSINNRLVTMNLTCVPSWREGTGQSGSYMAYLRPVEFIQ